MERMFGFITDLPKAPIAVKAFVHALPLTPPEPHESMK